MTAKRALAIGSVVLALLVVGAAIWVGTAIREMRGEIAAVSNQFAIEHGTQRSTLPGSAVASETAELASQTEAALFADVVLKQVSDIKVRVDLLSPTAGIEEVAQVIEEMDQWVFAADEATAASAKLNKLTQTLRGLIEGKIIKLLEQARVAETGTLATEILSQVNDLLSLYPVPWIAEQRWQLGQLTEQILATSQRVEDIRRLRYNSWAIDQISSGLAGYQDKKRRLFDDDAALVEECHRSLREIDPALLEPVTLDLYNYVIGLTARAVDDVYRVKLASGFADVETTRRTLADF
jgi:hypothetical protein